MEFEAFQKYIYYPHMQRAHGNLRGRLEWMKM